MCTGKDTGRLGMCTGKDTGRLGMCTGKILGGWVCVQVRILGGWVCVQVSEFVPVKPLGAPYRIKCILHHNIATWLFGLSRSKITIDNPLANHIWVYESSANHERAPFSCLFACFGSVLATIRPFSHQGV